MLPFVLSFSLASLNRTSRLRIHWMVELLWFSQSFAKIGGQKNTVHADCNCIFQEGFHFEFYHFCYYCKNFEYDAAFKKRLRLNKVIPKTVILTFSKTQKVRFCYLKAENNRNSLKFLRSISNIPISSRRNCENSWGRPLDLHVFQCVAFLHSCSSLRYEKPRDAGQPSVCLLSLTPKKASASASSRPLKSTRVVGLSYAQLCHSYNIWLGHKEVPEWVWFGGWTS